MMQYEANIAAFREKQEIQGVLRYLTPPPCSLRCAGGAINTVSGLSWCLPVTAALAKIQHRGGACVHVDLTEGLRVLLQVKRAKKQASPTSPSAPPSYSVGRTHGNSDRAAALD